MAQGREFEMNVVDEWVAFWNTYDLSQFDRLFLTDARVSYFSSEKEGLVRGADAVRAHHAGFGFVPGGKTSGNRLWLDDVHAERLGPAVVVTAIWYFRRAGSEQNQRGPVTLVYVEDGGRHRIAHANFGNYAG
jgi:hypothetical protein